MRRRCVVFFISGYFFMLLLGVSAQVAQMSGNRHPAMYFFVWDMYCGWTAYSTKYRVIAEGVSGKFYDLNPAPWGTFRPYNTQDRIQFLGGADTIGQIGVHTAARTNHEPLSRMFVIEEVWAKQFDIPDYIWRERFQIPKEPYKYTKVRVEMAGDGSVTQLHPSWLDTQAQMMLADNPRLKEDVNRTRPFWVVDEYASGSNRYFERAEPNLVSTQRRPLEY